MLFLPFSLRRLDIWLSVFQAFFYSSNFISTYHSCSIILILCYIKFHDNCIWTLALNCYPNTNFGSNVCDYSPYVIYFNKKKIIRNYLTWLVLSGNDLTTVLAFCSQEAKTFIIYSSIYLHFLILLLLFFLHK